MWQPTFVWKDYLTILEYLDIKICVIMQWKQSSICIILAFLDLSKKRTLNNKQSKQTTASLREIIVFLSQK